MFTIHAPCPVPSAVDTLFCFPIVCQPIELLPVLCHAALSGCFPSPGLKPSEFHVLVASGARSCLPPRLLLASFCPLTFLTCSFKFCSCCTLREDNCPLALGPCVFLVKLFISLTYLGSLGMLHPPPPNHLQMQVHRQRFAQCAYGSGAPTHCRTGLKVALCKGTRSTAVNPLGDGIGKGRKKKKKKKNTHTHTQKLSPYIAV